MTRRHVEPPTVGKRRPVTISIDPSTLTELDRLAVVDGRDRSHQIEALVRAEVERRRMEKVDKRAKTPV